MSRFMTSLIGVLIGGVVGFVLGVAGWMLFYYVVFMVPEGTPWRAMDQGAIPVVFTGPIGAGIGAALGVWFLRRRGKKEQQAPEP